MKNTAASLLVLLSLALTASSCSDSCCNAGVTKVCEDDLAGSQFATWDEYRAYLENIGYTCN